MKDSIILYTAYADKFKTLTDNQFGRLIRIMFEYQASGEVPEIDDLILKLSFDVVKVDMDRNNEKYERVVKRNQENGKKGGRPKNPMGYLGTQENPKEPKKADNDNDNDNDNVTFKKSNKNNKAYTADENLNKAIADFIEHRKKLRKPMTDKAVELFIKRLLKLSDSPVEQIELINIAIERGWQTVYPSNEKHAALPQRDNTEQLEELERRFMG